MIHRQNQSNDLVSTSLPTIAWVFLRLGSTAFGGPAAHIALMNDELVNRRRWLSEQQFLDLVGAANLMPGPNSTEVALHIGHRQRGLIGLVIAGVCFIMPAFLMVTGIAALYVNYGKLPAASGILYGLKPVILAIVLQALVKLARTALKTNLLIAISLAVAALYVLGINQIALLFGSGLLAAIIHFLKDREHREKNVLVGLALSCGSVIGFALALAAYTPKTLAFSPAALFLYFLKIGSVLYGSGYVLIAFLRSDLVENYHWITSTQLLDAVAVGQITPGPVFTTATFVGCLLGGTWGGVVATIGIFLPAFVLVAISGAFVRRLRDSLIAGHFIDGVNGAALALMCVVLVQLVQSAVVDSTTMFLAIIGGAILIRSQINSIWLMAAGAIIGQFCHHSS